MPGDLASAYRENPVRPVLLLLSSGTDDDLTHSRRPGGVTKVARGVSFVLGG